MTFSRSLTFRHLDSPTAMTVEASGRSEVGQRLFEYVQPAIDQMLLGNVGVKAIRLLTMTVNTKLLIRDSLLTISRQCMSFIATTKGLRGASLA